MPVICDRVDSYCVNVVRHCGYGYCVGMIAVRYDRNSVCVVPNCICGKRVRVVAVRMHSCIAGVSRGSVRTRTVSGVKPPTITATALLQDRVNVVACRVCASAVGMRTSGAR